MGSARDIAPLRGVLLFLTRGWGSRHKDAGSSAFRCPLGTRAGNHQQKRLQEAGPDAKIRAPGSNTRTKKMFAVFKTGGKQYRVAAEDVLKVAKLKGERGEIVEFGEVLVVGGDSVMLGAPTVAGATVAAEAEAHSGACSRSRRGGDRNGIGRRRRGEESLGQEGAEGQSQGAGGQSEEAEGQAKEMMQGGDAFVTFAV